MYGAGLIYTELANWESLSGARLMEILGNEIPLVQGSPSISVYPLRAAGRAVCNN